MKRIIIVGGGAGGLELATRLGRKFGRKGKIEVILVDKNPTHFWKPLLHEVATGAMDSNIDEVSYRVLARRNHFQFILGEMQSLQPDSNQLILAALNDGNQLVLPERTLNYDYLVLAIGSATNDFGTDGVAEHCIFLDNLRQAIRFHRKFVNAMIRADNQIGNGIQGSVDILIVGGGATGVELSAELINAAEVVREYGFKNLKPEHLNIRLLEAGPRLLPALPERISAAALTELKELNIKVELNARVTSASQGMVELADQRQINAELMVWAAGVKGCNVMNQLNGLELTRNKQLVVNSAMQSISHGNIFALGDCCACPQSQDKYVPPRAQSAHQMASHLAKQLPLIIKGHQPKPFIYQDHGSLVSLSQYSAIGTLMGNLSKGSLKVEGRIARLMYVSLYRMHQAAIYGWPRAIVIAMSDRLHRVFKPKLKLH